MKKLFKLLYFKVNERLIGTPRPLTRPRSTTSARQSRTVLDIRSVQPPTQPPVKKKLKFNFNCDLFFSKMNRIKNVFLIINNIKDKE
jgi:hypothetical protein